MLVKVLVWFISDNVTMPVNKEYVVENYADLPEEERTLAIETFVNADEEFKDEKDVTFQVFSTV